MIARAVWVIAVVGVGRKILMLPLAPSVRRGRGLDVFGAGWFACVCPPVLVSVSACLCLCACVRVGFCRVRVCVVSTHACMICP